MTDELKGLFDELENKRREAWVRAVLRSSESNDVAGYIGRRVPVKLFHALGLMALPVYGIDGDILKFSKERGLCPVVDATLTYAKTDKCPLIHSCRLIVVDDGCPVMARKMAGLTDRDVYIYRESESGSFERLTDRLEKIYGRRPDAGALLSVEADMREAAALLRRLKFYSELSGLQVYILEYYLNFLSMDERLKILREISLKTVFSEEPVPFVPVRVQSGAGIYRQIDRMFPGRSYRIIEDEEGPYDFVYTSCPFHEGTRIGYE